jgi:Tfp pilus assembly protein PilW
MEHARWSGAFRTNQHYYIKRNQKMKLKTSQTIAGFTLSETLVSLSLSSIVLAAAITCGISLQKSFSAVDNYFTTHMQQIRIIDYLNRDVKRGLIVTTSVDLQTVTMSVPSYIIQAGDPEAVANPSLVGTPRDPNFVYTSSGWQVNYTASPVTVVYSISGSSILRTENGVVTTIASSTDQLVPQSTDVELANTEYANTSVTFLPIFTSGNAVASRTGTSMYATAYLRNKRRG